MVSMKQSRSSKPITNCWDVPLALGWLYGFTHCNSTCGMYLSLTLQHGIIGIDNHEVYFNNSNTWSASPYPRARGTPID